MRILEWTRTFGLERTPIAQEISPSTNRWCYIKVGVSVYQRKQSAEHTDTPQNGRVCISSTLDRGSYLEFTKNYRN